MYEKGALDTRKNQGFAQKFIRGHTADHELTLTSASTEKIFSQVAIILYIDKHREDESCLYP